MCIAPAPAGAVDDSGKAGESAGKSKGDDDADAKAEEQKRKHQQTLDTKYDDQRAGKEAAEQVAATMGILPDGPLVEYVRAVGRRISQQTSGGFSYTFNVVDQDSPNAFALPGGYIYVSRGLLLLTNSEDELANVLGHEVAHADQRHAAARQQIVEGVPGFFQFMQWASLRAYGRDQERAADTLGQRLAARAGYDPHGMAWFLKSLEFAERLRLGSSRLPSFYDTHPSTRERVGVNSARADSMPFTRRPGIVDGRNGFLALLEGLSIGLSASEGVFIRNRFMHPDLGFSVRFPDGWETRNTHTAVGAVSPRQDAQVVLEFGGAGKDLKGAAEKFIKKSQKQGLRLEGLEDVNISGFKALRSKGTATTPRGSFHAVVTFISFDDVIFRIMGLALSRQLEGVFINTARSFRRITPRQLAQIKETRLRIAPARKGETLVALSNRTGNTWNVNMTAVVNAVHTNQPMEEGYGVKIAVAEMYKPPSKGAVE